MLGKGWLEGVSDRGDVGALENFEERDSDGREEVRVLVGIDVSDVDAGVLEASDLGVGFADDVLFTDLTEEEGAEEGDEGDAEVLAVGTDEGGDLLGW